MSFLPHEPALFQELLMQQFRPHKNKCWKRVYFKYNFSYSVFQKSAGEVNCNHSHMQVYPDWYKFVPGEKEHGEWQLDRSSHVNLISHTLMAWTDVWPGNQEIGEKKKKSTRSRAFQQTAYVPLRWLFHLGVVSANKSEQQSRNTLTRSCQVSSGEMSPLSSFLFQNLSVSVV